MLIIGLTGGIATGKSTIAQMFRDRDIPLHDADAAVHELLGPNGRAVPMVIAEFGADMQLPDGGIDRAMLGRLVFNDPKKRRQLESILHPLVANHRDHFLDAQRDLGARFVILDIPLLFEVGGDDLCDYIILAYADSAIQYERAMARPAMDDPKLRGILQSQIPIAEKVGKADLVLNTEISIAKTDAELGAWMASELEDILQKHEKRDQRDA
ncbi:dephospho-CoA kinase [Alphaproteobacteria bacterium]|nr:dephospho-CoA kinase [Alphaproteobacteria bacterium]